MNRGYVLTPLADADLDDIWDYVAERFGYDLADDVLESLHSALLGNVSPLTVEGIEQGVRELRR